MNKISARRKAHRRGYWAEWLSVLFLTLKGYKVSAVRYKTKLGEIDIVARRGNLVAIVEVKARPSVAEAVDAVTQTAKHRINSATDLWLAKQKDAANLSIRFDIIAVCPWKLPVHFQDAF
ncbi:MAG: YraN family protein [Pseudomonadota bacterium]